MLYGALGLFRDTSVLFPVSIYSHDRQKELESLCAWHVCNFEFDDALHCARSLIKTADSTGNDFRKLSAYAFAGQAYMAADKPDSAFIWLCEGLKLWEEDEDRYVKTKGYSDMKYICTIYNSLGK